MPEDCLECTDPSLIPQPLPGAKGDKGDTGATGPQGAAGVNAFTVLASGFSVPAAGVQVEIEVLSGAWIVPGQWLFIEDAGHFFVDGRTGNDVTISTPSVLYLNAAPGTSISSGAAVTPAGPPAYDLSMYTNLEARVTDLEDALAGAGATVTTYYQTTAPTGSIAVGSLWFDTDDNYKMHRWDGSAWVAISPTIELDPFGLGLRPIQVLGALPVSGMVEGDVVFLTTDKKLYRYTGTAWTAAVAAGDLVGQLPNGAIAANYIVAGMIAAGAINSTHVGANQIITQAANIADAVIGNAKIADLAASKLTAGIINGHIIQIAGAGGAVRSANYAPGSLGWNIDGNGVAEFNDVTVRGKLQAGRVSTDSFVFNAAAPDSYFPALATQAGNNGTPRNNLGVGGTVTILATFYGWSSGTGYAENRFGKPTTVFAATTSGGYTIPGGSYADTELVYRINGGGWIQMNAIAQRNLDNDGFFNIANTSAISGLAGGDTVEFGVRHKSPNAATSIGYVDLTVTAFNL